MGEMNFLEAMGLGFIVCLALGFGFKIIEIIRDLWRKFKRWIKN